MTDQPLEPDLSCIPESWHPAVLDVINGMSFNRAAHKHDCEPGRLNRICRKAGVRSKVSNKGGHNKTSEEIRERIRELYRQGVERQYLAARFGVGQSTVLSLTCDLTVDLAGVMDLARTSGAAFFMVDR